MIPLQELRMEVVALSMAVKADPKFFVSVQHYVQRLEELVTGRGGPITVEELRALASRLEEFWRQWRPTGGGDSFYIPPNQTSTTDPIIGRINRLTTAIEANGSEALAADAVSLGLDKQVVAPTTATASKAPCVFVGHGRNPLWARVKGFLQDEMGLATVAYESEPRAGQSIVPVLEKMLDQATFAVLVLTAEDETASGRIRARQNVVHEAGLFQGCLGFSRAILIVQQGLEEFSNVDGIQYIGFSGSDIQHTFYELQGTLRREGQIR